MVKNELLASWTYRRGELLKQRIMQKTSGLALLFGLVIMAAILIPLLIWQGHLFAKVWGWLLVAALLAMSWLVYRHYTLFGNLLFTIYRKLIPLKEEEILITSAKIITSKKTWILLGENRELTDIKFQTGSQNTSLVFNGQEKTAKLSKSFKVILPIPPQELALAQTIYEYFIEWLGR